ncbi:MAG: DsrE family protein [Armatimonadota bacterium]
MKQVLFIVRTAPYGSAAVPESVRACLGFGTMPVEVSYLLTDDGVWALAPGQQAEAIGAESAPGLIASLAELGVRIFAESEALQARGLAADGLGFPLTALAADQIARLIAAADAVITY